MQKQVQYIIKGMNRDMSISKFPADHSFENKNIRITQREDSTLLSVTNEKGPKEKPLIWDNIYYYLTYDESSQQWVWAYRSGNVNMEGKIVGHCVIDKYLVLFVKKTVDTNTYKTSVYRIEPSTGKTVELVTDTYTETDGFNDHLCFSDAIQALGVYENDTIIKVYWNDGKYQNKVINIVDPKKLEKHHTDNAYFVKFKPNDVNFIPTQSFNEEVTVQRVDSSNGVFAPGTIQYIFTYYNLYGQETAVFYQSDLYYTSFNDRGGKEDETVSNAFKISIRYSDIVPDFDYVRIYSILRTSINATPQCNIVADLNLREVNLTDNDTLTFIDTGTTGEAYDYNALLYANGELYSSETMAAKDLTLFNGNLNILIPQLPKDLKTFFRNAVTDNSNNSNTSIVISYVADKDIGSGSSSGYYPYNIKLNKGQREITTFKYGEVYRFGLQFLHKSGKWSDVVFLGDVLNTTKIGHLEGSAEDWINKTQLTRAFININIGDDATSYLTWLSDNGFIKLRPVVVYPELWDRNILAQGIVCPTVYNVEDRYSNRPFAYSSWYVRPNAGSNTLVNTLGSKNGVYNAFGHNRQIPNNTAVNAEIQCIVDTNQNPIVTGSDENMPEWIQKHKENFFIDKSIITFHSPELELSDDLDVIDMTNVKFRIIGVAPMTGFDSDMYLTTSTLGNFTSNENFNTSDGHEDTDSGKAMLGPGFYNEEIGVENVSTNGWRSRMGNVNWIDEETHYKLKHIEANHNAKTSPKWFGFFVYPWHRSKSLNNTVSPNDAGYESALLENKIITNARYSINTVYLDSSWTKSVSGIKIANNDSQDAETTVSLVKIPAPKNSGLGELNYYGSVDKIVVPSNDDSKKVGYPIVIAASSRSTDLNKESYGYSGGVETWGSRAGSNHELFTGKYDQRASQSYRDAVIANHAEGTLMAYIPEGFVETQGGAPTEDSTTWLTYVNSSLRRKYWQVSTFDPIRIRYKSTKHAVMAFDYTVNHEQVILPRIDGDTVDANITDNYGSFASGSHLFWEKTTDANKATATVRDTISVPNINGYGYLFIGELYRDDITNRFGGETEEALEKNTWLPAGEAINLSDIETQMLIADRGDTFYQRYDCLKTFPFTNDEKNSLIETVSFMCETRVNCDGRYDKNRGNATKFNINPSNFNLMNPAYNQRNNFFSYQYNNSHRVYPNHFNQVVYSLTKTLGEEIDTWAKMNFGSLLDVDGEYGEIVALVFFNNDIWCFQEKGISKILFNSRVQIPVSDGVPIEITNGMKVQGKVYITNKAGLQNKFAITSTPNGVYFVDGYNNTISIFNGQGIVNVSDVKGFREWLSKEDTTSVWKGYFDNGNPIKVFYDSTNQDVYFVSGTKCLVFSELLGEFTSFMDYEKTSVMDVVNGKFYALTDFKASEATNGTIRLWEMFEGDYNIFYKPTGGTNADYYKPFWITYNVNPDSTFDKTFDIIEFRSDSWNGNTLVTATNTDTSAGAKTFDTLTAWNEYQTGTVNLVSILGESSSVSPLKKKFRVWRANIPRQQNTINRMRNTWCKVQLKWTSVNTFKTVLHDVVIKYFV